MALGSLRSPVGGLATRQVLGPGFSDLPGPRHPDFGPGPHGPGTALVSISHRSNAQGCTLEVLTPMQAEYPSLLAVKEVSHQPTAHT